MVILQISYFQFTIHLSYLAIYGVLTKYGLFFYFSFIFFACQEVMTAIIGGINSVPFYSKSKPQC